MAPRVPQWRYPDDVFAAKLAKKREGQDPHRLRVSTVDYTGDQRYPVRSHDPTKRSQSAVSRAPNTSTPEALAATAAVAGVRPLGEIIRDRSRHSEDHQED